MTRTVTLGPETADKIAIVGSAPSSVDLTPFDDPSWSIWATSPGSFALLKGRRTDVWFELHRWMPYKPAQIGSAGTRPWFSPEFNVFLQNHQGPVFMTEEQPSIPTSVAYPYKEMLEKYGPYFFSSTIAWMLAFALDRQPKAIGLFGIDMAADSEYAYQRAGCQHFVGMAKAMGIEVFLPPESDLMRHSTLYGIGEHNQRHVKLSARKAELEAQKQNALQNQAAVATTIAQLDGALATIRYVLELWTDDLDPRLEQAFSFSGSHVNPLPGKPDTTGAQVLTFDQRKTMEDVEVRVADDTRYG